MDVFNQNWTEKIKSDPFVNKLLNSENKVVREKTWVRFWGPYREKQGVPIPGDVIIVEGKLYRWKRVRVTPENIARVQRIISRNAAGLHRVQFRYDNIGIPATLYDNTRPDSLYTLRYASLR